MRKFVYAPGLPGYGTRGVDGSIGIAGISTYFSSFNGDSDEALIDLRISEDKILIGRDASLPGWPNRKYQTGDIFIDNAGKVWKINLDNTPRYEYTGSQLASMDSLFSPGPTTTGSIVFNRYTNDFVNRILIDSVYTESTSAMYATARTVYGINGRDYGNVQYVNFEINGYHPYTIWSNSDQTLEHTKAIALVKVDGQDIWQFGARDDNNNVRDIDLYLDFRNVFAGNIYGTFMGTIQSPNLYLTGWLRVDGDSSVNRLYIRNEAYAFQNLTFLADGKSIRSKDGESEQGGFSLALSSGDAGSTVTIHGLAGGNLDINSGNGGTCITSGGVSGEGGLITIQAGMGGMASLIGTNGGSGGAIVLSGGTGGTSMGSEGIGGSGGSVLLKGGDGALGDGADGEGGEMVIIGGLNAGTYDISKTGKIYIGRTANIADRGQVFIASGTQNYPGMMMGDSSLGFYTLPGLKRISIAEKTSENTGTERFRFDVSTFHASGNVIAYSSMPSDIRLKENIEPLRFSLEKILNLKGVTYTKKGTNEKHIGFIAQEVEQYIPEVVIETNMIGYPDDEMYKTINYTEIIPHLVEAIKKQHSIINKQEIKIAALEDEIRNIKMKLCT